MKKLLSVLFIIILTVSLSTVAFAKNSYTEWTISNDGNSIMVDNSSFELYSGSLCPNDLFLPKSTFRYENDADYFLHLKKNVWASGKVCCCRLLSCGFQYILHTN